jgi:GH25 family lysozyme M1 (1,4-beta-N-acetylmuramidase)
MSTDVLDLSHHNGVESFAAIRKAGILGVIHKATESDDYADPTYSQRRVDARHAGLLWGAYHFLRPGDMHAQAQHFLKTATPGNDDLMCADHEDTGVSLDDLHEFLAAIWTLTKRRAVIYSGHVLKEQVGDADIPWLKEHQLWVAQYTTAPQPDWPKQIWPRYFLWQFTDQGSAPGVSGSVDCNRAGVDDHHLRAQWAGAKPDEPEAPAIPMPGPEHVVKITIASPPGVHIVVERVIA